MEHRYDVHESKLLAFQIQNIFKNNTLAYTNCSEKPKIFFSRNFDAEYTYRSVKFKKLFKKLIYLNIYFKKIKFV